MSEPSSPRLVYRRATPADGPVLRAHYARRWGQGLASEAARAVVEHAFRFMGLARILAGVDAGHEGSTAVLRRLGFTPVADGLWAIER